MWIQHVPIKCQINDETKETKIIKLHDALGRTVTYTRHEIQAVIKAMKDFIKHYEEVKEEE